MPLPPERPAGLAFAADVPLPPERPAPALAAASPAEDAAQPAPMAVAEAETAAPELPGIITQGPSDGRPTQPLAQLWRAPASPGLRAGRTDGGPAFGGARRAGGLCSEADGARRRDHRSGAA